MSAMRSSVRLTGCRPPRAASRPGRVTSMRFAGEARVERGVVERGLARGERVGDRVARAVDRLAGGLALVGRQRAQLLELRGDAAGLAEQRDAQRLERVGRRRRRRCRPAPARIRDVDVAHASDRSMRRRKRALRDRTPETKMGKDLRPSPRVAVDATAAHGSAGCEIAGLRRERALRLFGQRRKPAASCTAMSASTLRSRVMPAFSRPFMKRL